MNTVMTVVGRTLPIMVTAKQAAVVTRPPVIDIEPDADEGIPVRLVGVDYVAKQPKGLVALRMAQRLQASQGSTTDADEVLGQLRDFTTLVLGSADADAVMARLEDPDDPLDLKHVMALIRALAERVTGQPPT